MQAVNFQILRTSDQDLLKSLKAMIEDGDGPLACQKLQFTFLSSDNLEIPPNDFEGNEDLARIVNDHVRVFGRVGFHSSLGPISIRRNAQGKAQHDNDIPFDEVTVSPSNQKENPIEFARLVGFAQRHLGKAKITALESYLGEEAKVHFQARDVALARLETLVGSELSHDLEKTRQQRDGELQRKDAHLESKFQEKEQGLADRTKAREEQLEERASELDEREESLNLQEPKTERRQVFQELKDTLTEWATDFGVSEGTQGKRTPVHHILITLLLLFAAGTIVFLVEGIRAPTETSTTQVVALYIRAAVFLALFVSFGVFYVRWNTHWFQKHADEEFRLKKMQLDLKRAHWFVELAFQWKDEYKESLPPELVERLTRELFLASGDDTGPQPGFDSLASALLGASTKVKISSTGAEVELDKKGIGQLKRESQS